MPILDVTYPAGAIPDPAREGLIDELTKAVLRAERAPDTDLVRSITWVFIHELPPDDVLAGGLPPRTPPIRVEVTTPEGALSPSRRSELIAAATSAVCEAVGIDAPGATSVWVLLRDVPEGSWGAGGEVVRLSALRELAEAERERSAAA
jgi:phenylpyruvate tautomerase PptA (4-oxalocrotonate tautomerase family)